MGERLLRRVRDAIEQGSLLRPGERVAVALSGGADSVALLLLLEQLRKEVGVVLSVAHFNHKLRGKESDTDEKFATKLATKYKLAFHAGHGDVAEQAKREKANLEDMARRSRYEFFLSLVRNGSVDKIAVAHTADDQAETVLAHILRGTGLAGLGGIHPRVGPIVRPLLGVRRPELRAYLRARNQRWREDATNSDMVRMRARIRKKLIPVLEKQFQPTVVSHLAGLAELARDDEALLDTFARQRIDKIVDLRANSAAISIADLSVPVGGEDLERSNVAGMHANSAFKRRIVRQLVAHVKPRDGQLLATHVRAILELASSGKNGKRLQLPGGLEVIRERDRLIFRDVDKANRERRVGFEYGVRLHDKNLDVSVPELSCVFRFRVIDWPLKRGDTIEQGFVLDCAKLQGPIVLRNWRPGDRLRPYGHRGVHKLKRLLSKKRISSEERADWPVLADGDVVAWSRGFGAAAEFAASIDTRMGVLISEEPIL
jgi:tRNA(Ile)-lysidine synthase